MKPRYLKQKFYVGISGHRTLKSSNIEEYKERIIRILEEIAEENFTKEVIIVSPLAEGADRLIVYAAKELGLRYEILLPMPIEYYETDFDDTSYDEFYTLFYEARGSEFVDLCEGCTYKTISEYDSERDRQYQKVGHEIVDKSDFIIFLWDQVENEYIGGTSDIVKYTKEKGKSFVIVECERE